MRHARHLTAAALLLVATGTAISTASAEVAGKTTLETTIKAGEGAFRLLGEAPGESFVVRGAGIGAPQAGRESRRRSLLYFGQLSDFQLTDEESPSRVETVDNAGGPVSAAWRPMEALGPHTVDAAIRQINAFVAASPVPGAGGRRARMEFGITTGDSADNQQLNETEWVVRLLEGGTLNPNSGVGDGSCGTDPAEAPRYTGVSDLDDYLVPSMEFYDPDDPQGAWSAWPTYPGLLDKAQQPFETPGLDVPVYVTFGNHDALAQGNQAANQAFEAVAIGCAKPLAGATGVMAPVPPDPARRYVSKREYKALHRTATSPNAHGFGFLDSAEDAASGGAAGYYSWTPKPGFRFIALDTVCEGGVTGPSAAGNIDDPQFRWLEEQLRQATERDQLVVLFSHHAIASMNCDVPDEAAPPCGETNPQGYPANAGCDLDPRDSGPIHLGADMTDLPGRYPHVIAWVAGHSHVNSVDPFATSGGGGFWSIRVAAEIDWPQQSRLLEVMDNRDGTLSIFGTIVDHGAPAETPPDGTPAAGFGIDDLASLSRLFAANDPQGGIDSGEGDPGDRNVELLVADPRRNPVDPTSLDPGGPTARRCAAVRGRIGDKRVHRVRLGASRRSIRRRYPTRGTRRRRAMDVFCLADGKRIRVGYPTPRLRRSLGRPLRRRTARRAVVAVTSSPAFRIRRVRRGTPARRFRRLVRRERFVLRNRRSRWYTAPGKRATLLFRVRGGRVLELGLADKRLTRGRAASRRLLRSL